MLTNFQNSFTGRLTSKFATRNAWQSLVYSPISAIVSAPNEYLWKHLLTDHLSAWQPHPIANIGEQSVVAIIDTGCTTSFALNSGVIQLNVTKISHKVEKWWLINVLKSEFQCHNPFLNASVPNVGRSSFCNRVTTKLQTPFLNSEVTGPIFTKFLLNVAKSSPCDLFKTS